MWLYHYPHYVFEWWVNVVFAVCFVIVFAEMAIWNWQRGHWRKDIDSGRLVPNA
jgi:hypothetical protein